MNSLIDTSRHPHNTIVDYSVIVKDPDEPLITEEDHVIDKTVKKEISGRDLRDTLRNNVSAAPRILWEAIKKSRDLNYQISHAEAPFTATILPWREICLHPEATDQLLAAAGIAAYLLQRKGHSVTATRLVDAQDDTPTPQVSVVHQIECLVNLK